MQETSQLYQTILASDNHWYETRLVVTGVGVYTDIFSLTTDIEMFHGTPTIGSAVAGEISVSLIYPSEDIPSMAEIRPQVRICNATSQSEWLDQGVFYIDTRERTKNDNGLDILQLHGYDAMLRAEQPFQSDTITGDSLDTALVAEIARIMGVEVDARTYTLMNRAYPLPLPVGYSCREVLGYIASMYVGSFIMSDSGKLRLVSILELPPETNYLIDREGDAITFGGDRILV